MATLILLTTTALHALSERTEVASQPLLALFAIPDITLLQPDKRHALHAPRDRQRLAILLPIMTQRPIAMCARRATAGLSLGPPLTTTAPSAPRVNTLAL